MPILPVFDIIDPPDDFVCHGTYWMNLDTGRVWKCNESTRRYELITQNMSTQAEVDAVAEEVTKRLQVEVDFGLDENSIARQFVPATWVTADSLIDADVIATATDDHDPDDVVCESLSAYVTQLQPGIGFRLLVRAPTQTWGRYMVSCIGR